MTTRPPGRTRPGLPVIACRPGEFADGMARHTETEPIAQLRGPSTRLDASASREEPGGEAAFLEPAASDGLRGPVARVHRDVDSEPGTVDAVGRFGKPQV